MSEIRIDRGRGPLVPQPGVLGLDSLEEGAGAWPAHLLATHGAPSLSSERSARG